MRLLRLAGLDPVRDVRRARLSAAESAEALKDGKIDAFFWSSGLPNGAVLDLMTTLGRRVTLLPTADVLPVLQRRHGSAIFLQVTIPRGAYPGLDVDVPTVGTSSLLVVDQAMSEPLAYEITRALFEHQHELAAIRPEARTLRPGLASTGSPVPFHSGAIRFYRERGVWSG
jgi:TRAP transporter TAXI family solute receptor